MAAGTIDPYAANIDDVSLRDVLAATVKLMLVDSGYVPDTSETGHSVLADVTGEIANGNGYTTGGYTLVSGALTAIAGGWKFVSADPTWTATGTGIPAWRRGVLYVSGALWGKTSPLLACFLADATPADQPLTTVALSPLTITCPAAGWIYKAKA